jgi:hypothetical protein
VQVYTEHADSVYGAAWSAVDPWAFATVSYDGKVCVHKVPRHEKYKILLECDGGGGAAVIRHHAGGKRDE